MLSKSFFVEMFFKKAGRISLGGFLLRSQDLKFEVGGAPTPRSAVSHSVIVVVWT